MDDIDHQIADDEASGQRAHLAIATLTGEFDKLISTGQLSVHSEKSNLFLAVYSWWMWINRSSKLVALAYRQDLDHEVAPTVRSIVEHALVLQWVIDEGDEALHALAEHGEKNRRKLLRELEESGWPIPPEVEQQEAKSPEVPHRLAGTISSFFNICNIYDARKLYVSFRLLSAYAHPSVPGATAYITETMTLRSHAEHTWGPLIQTAMCLIQATRTMNPLIEGQPMNDAIARAEQLFGLEVGLWNRRAGPGTAS